MCVCIYIYVCLRKQRKLSQLRFLLTLCSNKQFNKAFFLKEIRKKKTLPNLNTEMSPLMYVYFQHILYLIQ